MTGRRGAPPPALRSAPDMPTDPAALLAAIKADDASRLAALLAADPAALATTGPKGESLLLLCAYAGAKSAAAALRARGAPVNAFEAAALGDAAALERLLEADPANAEGFSPDGWTALHLAAFFGHGEAASLLMGHGAGVDTLSWNATANTPLHAAIAAGRTEMARYFLAHGSDPNRECAGWTPLQLAAGGGKGDIVDLLLDAGADKAFSNANGTAAAVAAARGHAALAQRLAPPAAPAVPAPPATPA